MVVFLWLYVLANIPVQKGLYGFEYQNILQTRSKCTEQTNRFSEGIDLFCKKFMYATDCSKQLFNQQLVISVATPYHHRVNIHGYPMNTW